MGLKALYMEQFLSRLPRTKHNRTASILRLLTPGFPSIVLNPFPDAHLDVSQSAVFPEVPA